MNNTTPMPTKREFISEATSLFPNVKHTDKLNKLALRKGFKSYNAIKPFLIEEPKDFQFPVNKSGPFPFSIESLLQQMEESLGGGENFNALHTKAFRAYRAALSLFSFLSGETMIHDISDLDYFRELILVDNLTGLYLLGGYFYSPSERRDMRELSHLLDFGRLDIKGKKLDGFSEEHLLSILKNRELASYSRSAFEENSRSTRDRLSKQKKELLEIENSMFMFFRAIESGKTYSFSPPSRKLTNPVR